MAGKTRKSGMVRVTAVKNLDLMNAGEVVELDRDDQVQRLLDAGLLVEVDENGEPYGDVSVPAVEVVDSGRSVNEAPTASKA